MTTGSRRRLPLLAALAVSSVCSAAGTDTFGRQEHVRLYQGPREIELTTVLGTTPDSLLHVREMKYFFRDSGTWVRFDVDNGAVVSGDRMHVETPLLKDLRIPQKDGSIDHVALIRATLCVGSHRITTDLRVSDRVGYTAPLELSAAALAGIGRIDPKRQFLREPSCPAAEPAPSAGSSANALPSTNGENASPSTKGDMAFQCDGRTHCSQMHSCAEAKYFLANCPDTQMDGDGDGIPCEDQFCGH